jgi:hypothetical protein
VKSAEMELEIRIDLQRSDLMKTITVAEEEGDFTVFTA